VLIYLLMSIVYLYNLKNIIYIQTWRMNYRERESIKQFQDLYGMVLPTYSFFVFDFREELSRVGLRWGSGVGHAWLVVVMYDR
jgi:hypothetical protein